MRSELSAAVAYLRSLIEQSDSCSWNKSNGAMQAFSDHLYPALANRCSISSWNEQDPEIGSADRVIHWQVQPGGEGADDDLLESCWKGMESFVGRRLERTKARRQALMVETLPTSFSLWIDAGCVAVRLGSGPGLNPSSSLKTNVNEADHANGCINVIWGELPLLSASTVKSSSRPNVTLSSEIASPALSSFSTSSSSSNSRLALGRRPCAIAIVDPASPSYLGLGRPPYAPSPLSACSTSSGSSLWSATSADSILSRSSSLSSTSSLNSSDGGWSPRLMESSLKEKDLESTVVKPDLLTSNIVDDSGDLTVQDIEAADTTVCFAPSSDTLVAPSTSQKETQQPSSSFPTDSSVTSSNNKASEETRISNARPDAPTRVVPQPAAGIKEARLYDNGKVGVLGGGVKLGGGAPKPPSNNRQTKPNHGHSQSMSISQGSNNRVPFGKSSVANSYNNHHTQQQQFQTKRNLQQQQQFRAPYSAPTHTIPLPQQGQQQYPQHQNQYQYHLQIQQEQQQREAALHNHLYNLSLEHQQRKENRGDAFPTLPVPHGYNGQQKIYYGGQGSQQMGGRPMTSSSSYSSNLSSSASSDCSSSVSGNEYGSDYSLNGAHRSRTRGRRSRGRGSGRAARRQAAAMRALEESEAKCLDLDLDEFDFYDDEEDEEHESNAQIWSGSGSKAASCSSLVLSSPASSAGELLSSLNSTPSSCYSQTIPLPFSSPNDFDRLNQATGFMAPTSLTSQSSSKLQDLTHSNFASSNQGFYAAQGGFNSQLNANGGMSLGLDLGLEQAWDASEMTPRATYVGTF